MILAFLGEKLCLRSIIWLLLTAWLLPGCGYNPLQQQDERIRAVWAEVVNQYQRRADVPKVEF